MPFGSVLGRFEYVDLTSADGIHIRFKNNWLTRFGFRILGIPHLGLRLRARKIVKNMRTGDVLMLDAGSGTGIYSFSLANRVRQVEAVDVSEQKVESARAVNFFPNTKFSVGDITALKYEDGVFDLIVCSDVLEHVKDDGRALSELARVLKDGGILLMTVPSNSKRNSESYRKYGHERAGYATEDIMRMCERHGLQILKSEPYSCFLSEAFSRTLSGVSRSSLLTAALFYPMYILALAADILSERDHCGLFFKLGKGQLC